MFDSKEIQFMKSLGLTLNFASVSDDDFVKAEAVVGDFYTQEAQRTDEASEKILLCESILDKLWP